MSEENKPHFEAAIDATKRAYIASTEEKQRELVEEAWDVPERLVFGEGYVETEAKKSVMQPFYSDERWRTETNFIEFLEKKNDVVWWFKNGARDATYFAVPYAEGAGSAPFYVDFIVAMKDGSIGLFDPHGSHLADFPAKSDGLLAYIAKLKKKGVQVFGGIVANTDDRSFTGQWMVYEGKGSDAVLGALGAWRGWTELNL